MRLLQAVKRWWINTTLDDTAGELKLLLKHLSWLRHYDAKAHKLRANFVEAHYQYLEMQAAAVDDDTLQAFRRRRLIFKDRLHDWQRRVSPYGHLGRESTTARIAKLQSKQRRLTST